VGKTHTLANTYCSYTCEPQHRCVERVVSHDGSVPRQPEHLSTSTTRRDTCAWFHARCWLSLLWAGALAVPAAVYANPIEVGWPGHAGGFVYLDNNTAGTNTISGFSRGVGGALTPLPGSPFAAGGAGLGAGLASQGAIQTTDYGHYLLAVDAGSNQISVLRIGPDGSLTPVPGSPFSSGGVEPNSIAVNDGWVFVSNTGAGGTNYTGFTLSSGGQLDPIPGSAVTLPEGSAPGEIVLNRDDTRLVGMRVGTSLIDSFTLDRYGRPHAALGSPYAAQGLGPFGSQFRPTNPDELFVDNATTAPAWAPSRPLTTYPTANCFRSGPHHSPTSRPRRAGR
jgi:hypothetical protein